MLSSSNLRGFLAVCGLMEASASTPKRKKVKALQMRCQMIEILCVDIKLECCEAEVIADMFLATFDFEKLQL